MPGNLGVSTQQNPDHLVWANPAIGTQNTGDYIIEEAVHAHVFSDRSALHVELGLRFPVLRRWEQDVVASSRAIILGGSNFLPINVKSRLRWHLDPFLLRRTRGRWILCGVGAFRPEDSMDPITKVFLRSLLNPDVPHAVRDGRTAEHLCELGFEAINTSCPTVWGLGDVVLDAPELTGGVLTTLTDYWRKPVDDSWMLTALLDRYETVSLWPQGARDLTYFFELVAEFPLLKRVSLLGPGLSSLDRWLKGEGHHYVGPRLHCGIRALQHGRNAHIIATDERTRTICQEVGIPHSGRGDRHALEGWLLAPSNNHLTIPHSEIAKWSHAISSFIES